VGTGADDNDSGDCSDIFIVMTYLHVPKGQGVNLYPQ
jgi:hypothetical protein